jgi:hypothetical protein
MEFGKNSRRHVLHRYARLVCTDDNPAGVPPPVLHDFEPAIEIELEPVDSVRITTLMDNITDIFMPDQGPAHRVSLGAGRGRQRR